MHAPRASTGTRSPHGVVTLHRSASPRHHQCIACASTLRFHATTPLVPSCLKFQAACRATHLRTHGGPRLPAHSSSTLSLPQAIPPALPATQGPLQLHLDQPTQAPLLGTQVPPPMASPLLHTAIPRRHTGSHTSSRPATRQVPPMGARQRLLGSIKPTSTSSTISSTMRWRHTLRQADRLQVGALHLHQFARCMPSQAGGHSQLAAPTTPNSKPFWSKLVCIATTGHACFGPCLSAHNAVICHHQCAHTTAFCWSQSSIPGTASPNPWSSFCK